MNHTPLEQDPAIYLRQQPAPESLCHILVEQIDSHDGAPAPMHMLAKVAVRLHQFAGWAARWDGREKLARRVGAFVIGAALANMAAIGAWWFKAHDARVEAAAKAEAADRAFLEYRDNVRRELEDLKQDVRDLRRDLRRMVDKSSGDVGVVAVGVP